MAKPNLRPDRNGTQRAHIYSNILYEKNGKAPFRVLPLAEFVGYRAVNLRYIFGILRNRQRGLPLRSRLMKEVEK